MSNVLKGLPSVSELLDSPPLRSLVSRVSQSTVVSGVRRFLDQVRSEVPTAAQVSSTAGDLADRIARWISSQQQMPASSAINGTGVLLTSQLDGPPLADEAVQAMADRAIAYGSRPHDRASLASDLAISKLASRLTSCESAVVLSSATAAVLLAVQAIAKGKEVIVARGDLTETPEQSRWLDVLTAGGVKVKEVGAANLVRLADFTSAISSDTGAILRLDARSENASEPTIAQLSLSARERKVPLIQFLGASGIATIDSEELADLLTAPKSLAAGTDVVIVAGDGLLGGPRAGLVLGRKVFVDQIAVHPLAAALAVDRLSAAALQATLELHLDPQQLEFRVPTISLLVTPLENLRNRAQRLAAQMNIPGVLEASMADMPAYLSSHGAGPAIASCGILLRPQAMSVDMLRDKLARSLPSIAVLKSENTVAINLRTVMPRQDLALVAAVDLLRPVDQARAQTESTSAASDVPNPTSEAGDLPSPEIV